MLIELSQEARKLLGWSQERLAAAADLTPAAVEEFEAGSPATPDVILAIRTALEAAGVEFIPENGGGAGVRLKKQDHNN